MNTNMRTKTHAAGGVMLSRLTVIALAISTILTSSTNAQKSVDRIEDGKTYYLYNASPGNRVNKPLTWTFDRLGDLSGLQLGGSEPNPWKFTLVEGTTDEYYLTNRWRGPEMKYFGDYLSWKGVHGELTRTRLHPTDKVPWLVKKTGSGDYTLQSHWGKPSDSNYDYWLSWMDTYVSSVPPSVVVSSFLDNRAWIISDVRAAEIAGAKVHVKCEAGFVSEHYVRYLNPQRCGKLSGFFDAEWGLGGRQPNAEKTESTGFES
ncbi:MAG: hypothetical protein ACI8UO_000406, partial [Verrucomicrobiales bacterium]